MTPLVCVRPPTMTVNEVATALRIGKSSVWDMIAKGELRSIKVRDCRRILTASVDALLKAPDRHDGYRGTRKKLVVARVEYVRQSVDDVTRAVPQRPDARGRSTDTAPRVRVSSSVR